MRLDFNKILGGLAWMVVFYLLALVIPTMGRDPAEPSLSQLILSKVFLFLTFIMLAYTVNSVIETVFKKSAGKQKP